MVEDTLNLAWFARRRQRRSSVLLSIPIRSYYAILVCSHRVRDRGPNLYSAVSRDSPAIGEERLTLGIIDDRHLGHRHRIRRNIRDLRELSALHLRLHR